LDRQEIVVGPARIAWGGIGVEVGNEAESRGQRVERREQRKITEKSEKGRENQKRAESQTRLGASGD
jgi:hypothetical protein